MRLIMFVLVLVFVLIPAVYPAIPDYIVLYFSFDKGEGNKVVDKSQYHNDGEIIGEVKWDKGKYGGSLKLDGSKTVVTIPASDSLTTLKPPMGLGTWFKPVSFTRADCQCLADMEATATNRTDGWEFGP